MDIGTVRYLKSRKFRLFSNIESRDLEIFLETKMTSANFGIDKTPCSKIEGER
jgi:hypothetical protein